MSYNLQEQFTCGDSLCNTTSAQGQRLWPSDSKVELVERCLTSRLRRLNWFGCRMLARDQAERYSIEEVLAHPYLTAHFECSAEVAEQARANREHSDGLIRAKQE